MPTGVYKRTKKWKLSDETKMRISTSMKGRHSPSGFLGKTHSEDTRKRLRENHGPKFHTAETKNKIRMARLRQKLPTIDTSIELKFKAYLDKKGVDYIHPFNLGDRFQCDFYLPFINLIVECDGTYWHSRPDMVRRDKSKDAYAKKCGFNILRIDEQDINNNNFYLDI